MSPAETALNALTAYEQGNSEAVDQLLNLRKELLSKISFGKPKPSSQSYCTYNLLEEWFAIYNSQIQISNGIAAIKKLLLWAKHNESVQTIEMFQQPEWKQLVQLRGPVEAILHCRCRKCGKEFLGMGTSGFSDEAGWICSVCGAVIFRSVYNLEPAPVCKCGGKTFSNCPNCDSKEFELLQTSSPYGYFSNHTWQRVN
jgi:hypothetical protein